MAETIKIGGELESTATGNVVAAASAIKDKVKNKYQNEINDDVARHENEIHGTGGIDSRLTDVEQMEQIVIDGGEAQIATGTDFNNPDASQRVKVTTVGAVLDGADGKPTLGSEKLAKSGGIVTNLRDTTYVSKDASSLIGTWVVDGTVITFEGTGMNGTFTSHTNPNKPTATRPYFRFQNFIVGHKYRLRLDVSISSTRTDLLRLFYANSQTATFSACRLVDITGDNADVKSGKSLDCVFLAESSKTYLGFTADAFGIDETITISNFSITDVSDVYDLDIEKLNIKDGYGTYLKEYCFMYNRYVNIDSGVQPTTNHDCVIRKYNISAGKKYKVSGHTLNSANARLYVIYDSLSNVLASEKGTTGYASVDVSFIAPNNAATITVAGNTTHQDAGLWLVGADGSDLKLDEYKKRFDEDEKILGLNYDNVEQALVVARHITGTNEISAEGTRLSIVFKVWKGWGVTYSGNFGGGCLAEVFSSADGCLLGNNVERLQSISGYTTTNVSATINYDGYLGFKFKKSDNSAFSDQDVEDALDSLTFKISGNGILTDFEEGIKETFDDIKTSVGETYDANDFELVMWSSRTRIRLLHKVTKGSQLMTQCGLHGISAAIFDTRDKALIFSTNYLQLIATGYTTEFIDDKCNYDGWLVVTMKKDDDSAFTDTEVEEYIASCYISLNTGLKEDISKLQKSLINDGVINSKTRLFIGSLVQKGITSSGFTAEDTKKVSTISSMNVPHKGATLIFVLPNNIRVEIRSGIKSNTLSHDNTGKKNGDSFTFADDAVYFRLCFSKVSGSSEVNVSVSEVSKLIEKGDIIICYNQDSDIIERNAETEKYVRAMMRPFKNSTELTFSHLLPIFAHTSDLHGDATRFKQFMDYCDYLGVDAALVSGDVVALYPYDSSKYIDDLADSHDTMTLLCMGNHDAYGLGTRAQHEQIMNHLIIKNEVVTNPNETYPTYFYKDFADKKIRVIALNSYEDERLTWTTYFTEEQCNWFIDVLASTPQDYGVIVMYHALESEVVKENAHSNFYQDIQLYKGYWTGTTNQPIKKIIDAFISKTTLSLSYDTRTYGDYGTVTVNVTADFTSLNTGVEFIAHVTGHEHADGIGLVGGVTNRQVMLNICCGGGMYGFGSSDIIARCSDLPREGRGSVQDAFNIYAIDRDEGTIRIARVGSNMAPNGIRRDFLIMPYK